MSPDCGHAAVMHKSKLWADVNLVTLLIFLLIKSAYLRETLPQTSSSPFFPGQDHNTCSVLWDGIMTCLTNEMTDSVMSTVCLLLLRLSSGRFVHLIHVGCHWLRSVLVDRNTSLCKPWPPLHAHICAVRDDLLMPFCRLKWMQF